jgi:DNA-binding transcriptional MerR regulator
VNERQNRELWRIDDLAHRTGITVDTVRYYQREGLLPPAERQGRSNFYGPEHVRRIDRIKELQQHRFSLAAIRALLEAERPGLVEGIFGGDEAGYSFDELVERAGIDPALASRVHSAGLLRDPAEYGREAYDSADLDMLSAVAQLSEIGLPEGLVVELVRIYSSRVELMESEVVELFSGEREWDWAPGELETFQARVTPRSQELLGQTSRLIDYAHRRTLQRLVLGAIEAAADDGGGDLNSDY